MKEKAVKISIIFFIIISIIFWVFLFVFSPGYIKFTDLNVDFPIEADKILEYQKTQGNIEGAILIYGLLGFLLVYLVIDNPETRKSLLPATFILCLAIYVISSLFYFYVFQGHVILWDGDITAFALVKSLPFIIIAFWIFRKVFMAFKSEEPQLVGKFALFTDPVNWLFTTLVIAGGLTPGFLIPMF